MHRSDPQAVSQPARGQLAAGHQLVCLGVFDSLEAKDTLSNLVLQPQQDLGFAPLPRLPPRVGEGCRCLE